HLAEMGEVADATVRCLLGHGLTGQVVAVHAARAAEDDARPALARSFEQYARTDQVGSLGAERLTLRHGRPRLGSEVVDPRWIVGQGAGAVERPLDSARIGHVALDQGEAVGDRYSAALRAREIVETDDWFAEEQEATHQLGAYVPYAGQQR